MLEASMTISQPKQIRARPKFVGYSLLIFAIPLALTTLWLLKKHGIIQAVSLGLLSMPLCYFVIKCLSTKEPDAVDLISLRHARAIYLFCLIASIALWILEGLSYAAPGLIAALLFCTREPIIVKLARGGGIF